MASITVTVVLIVIVTVRAQLLGVSDSCDPMDCSPLGSSVQEILQARTLEWVTFTPPGDLPDAGINSSANGSYGNNSDGRR